MGIQGFENLSNEELIAGLAEANSGLSDSCNAITENLRQFLSELAAGGAEDSLEMLYKDYGVAEEDVSMKLLNWQDFVMSASEKNTHATNQEILYLGFLDSFNEITSLTKKINNFEGLSGLYQLCLKTIMLLQLNMVLDGTSLKLRRRQMVLSKSLEDSPKKASKNAHDSRYNSRRELLNELGRVARKLWEGGSTHMHYQMKDYLLNEYEDSKGNVPFSSLPEKSALNIVKQVAKEINRPDLISGQKKSQ
jgi:hypothetical protein